MRTVLEPTIYLLVVASLGYEVEDLALAGGELQKASAGAADYLAEEKLVKQRAISGPKWTSPAATARMCLRVVS